LIRAVGPSLAAFLSGAMSDPQMELVANGTIVASNDNWAPELAAIASGVGAFALAPGSLDAALVATATPGVNYSVVVQGRGAPANAPNPLPAQPPEDPVSQPGGAGTKGEG
jgi:hypothetical protein